MTMVTRTTEGCGRPLSRWPSHGHLRGFYTWTHGGGGVIADVSGGKNLDQGAKPAALCRTDSVLVSSSSWPKAFLVRSLVGPSFLGFVLFILPRGSAASVERQVGGRLRPLLLPIPAPAVGTTPEGRRHWSRQKHGDTAMKGEQVMQGWENGGRACRSAGDANGASNWAVKGVGGFFSVVKHEVWMRPGRVMVPLQGRAGASSAGARREERW